MESIVAARRDQEAGLEFHVKWVNGDISREPNDNVKFAEALEQGRCFNVKVCVETLVLTPLSGYC